MFTACGTMHQAASSVHYTTSCKHGLVAPEQWRAQEFCLGGGVQQIQLRTEDRDNGDLGAIAP